MHRLAGAVLVGGASTRLGQDKALLELTGVPLCEQVGDVVRATGAAPVAAVGRSVLDARTSFDVVVPDRWPGEGPLGGLLTALRWSPAPWLVVVACDLAWLTPEALAELVAAAPGDAHVVMAETDRVEPLCACWDVERVAPELQAAFDAGERSIRRALRGVPVRRVEVSDALAWRDLDTPDDLGRWQAERAVGGDTT